MPKHLPICFLQDSKSSFSLSQSYQCSFWPIFSLYFAPLLQEHKSLSFLPAISRNYFSFLSSSSPLPSAAPCLFRLLLSIPSLSVCQDNLSVHPWVCRTGALHLKIGSSFPGGSRDGEQTGGTRATSCFCGIGMLHRGGDVLNIQPGWAPNCQFLGEKKKDILGPSLVFVPLNPRQLCPA